MRWYTRGGHAEAAARVRQKAGRRHRRRHVSSGATSARPRAARLDTQHEIDGKAQHEQEADHHGGLPGGAVDVKGRHDVEGGVEVGHLGALRVVVGG